MLMSPLSFSHQGPHLLAPTGSNLQKYGKEGTVFAGYHYDLNFLTIHGRSRFPGLSIWLRNDKKVEVKVPVGCLLIQAGKQVASNLATFESFFLNLRHGRQGYTFSYILISMNFIKFFCIFR